VIREKLNYDVLQPVVSETYLPPSCVMFAPSSLT